MFQFVETIRAENGKIQNIEYHQWRLNKTFVHFYPDNKSFELSQLLFLPSKYRKGLVKIRFLYNATNYSVEFDFYTPKQINCLQLVECNDIDYNYKYLNRKIFEKLRQKASKCNEILIVKHGLITDTSFSNIIFFDGKNWHTPATPLLEGTFRKKLLDEGRIFPEKIHPSDLNNFTHFKLINAMLGWNFPPMPTEKIIW